MENDNKKRRIFLLPAVIAYILCMGLIVFETVGKNTLYGGEPPVMFTLGIGAAERLLLSAAFVCISVYAGFTSLLRPHIKGGIIAFIVSAAVALANFPFFTLGSGELTYTASAGESALYLLNCIAIGLFEETAFRGILLPLLYLYIPNRKHAGILSILLSAAAFALLHAFNILTGASVTATLLQVGYTFLTGCMFGVLTLLTRSVVPGIILHTLYDIGGTMVASGVAAGAHWNTPAAVVMAAVSAVAGVYLIIAAFRNKKPLFPDA